MTMSANNGPDSQKTLQIGIVAEEVQMTDIVCVDLFGNCETQYVRDTVVLSGQDNVASARNMTFHWIASTLEPTRMTPGIKFKPTMTYDDCPRDLDILIIGGPMPTHRPEAARKFMREMFTKTKIVMTTCVGSWWLADAGVLQGHKCTTNREALHLVKKQHPEIEWLDQRWVVDQKPGGELWTAGGAQAGETISAVGLFERFDKG